MAAAAAQQILPSSYSAQEYLQVPGAVGGASVQYPVSSNTIEPVTKGTKSDTGQYTGDTGQYTGYTAPVGYTIASEDTTDYTTGYVPPSTVEATGYVPPSIVEATGYVPPSTVEATGYVPPSTVEATGYVPPSTVEATGYVPPSTVEATGYIPPSTVEATGYVPPSTVPGESVPSVDTGVMYPPYSTDQLAVPVSTTGTTGFTGNTLAPSNTNSVNYRQQETLPEQYSSQQPWTQSWNAGTSTIPVSQSGFYGEGESLESSSGLMSSSSQVGVVRSTHGFNEYSSSSTLMGESSSTFTAPPTNNKPHPPSEGSKENNKNEEG